MGPTHISPSPEQFHFEVVDIESGERAPDGMPGLLVMSHLNRRGTVLLRYRVGDIVGIENGECGHCGRTGPRFTSDPYRADGLVKIKGTLVDPQALHGSLSPLLSVDGVSDYQLRIGRAVESDRYSGDRLAVRIACSPQAREAAAERVRSLASLAIEVTPEVEFLPQRRDSKRPRRTTSSGVSWTTDSLGKFVLCKPTSQLTCSTRATGLTLCDWNFLKSSTRVSFSRLGRTCPVTAVVVSNRASCIRLCS